MTNDKDLFPVWNDKYDKIGITPHELYMRQNGLCWLTTEVSPGGEAVLHCTDGTDKAPTSLMLNPTFECMRCVSRFTEKVISDAIKETKQTAGEDAPGDNT